MFYINLIFAEGANKIRAISAPLTLEDINVRTCNVPYFKGIFDYNALLFIFFSIILISFFITVIFKKPNMYFAKMQVKEASDITQIKSIFILTILFLIFSSFLSLYFRDCHAASNNFGSPKIIAHWASTMMTLSLGILLIIQKPFPNKKKVWLILGLIALFIPVYFFINLTYTPGANFFLRNLPYTSSLIFLILFYIFGFIQIKADEKWTPKKLSIYSFIVTILFLYFFLINISEKLW